MKKKIRFEKESIISILASLAIIGIFNLLFYNKMPDILPVHWGFSGEPDSFATKFEAYVKSPLIIIALSVIGLLFMDNDPKNFNQKNKMLSMGRFLFPIITFFIYIVTTMYGLEIRIGSGNIMGIGIGLLFIFIGNYLPKTKRNYTVGIKLPWTMESDENWNKTHRLGGICYVIGGLLMILGNLLNMENFYYILLFPLIIPIVYSLYLHSIGI